jgi:hypothetical protein
MSIPRASLPDTKAGLGGERREGKLNSMTWRLVESPPDSLLPCFSSLVLALLTRNSMGIFIAFAEVKLVVVAR